MIYKTAIETMMLVMTTDDVELKALAVERSILIAIETFKATYMVDFSDKSELEKSDALITDKIKVKLVEYLVS